MLISKDKKLGIKANNNYRQEIILNFNYFNTMQC